MLENFDVNQTIVPPPNNVPYVMAVTLMMVAGVVGVVVISVMRPAQDNTDVITKIFGFIIPTTLSLLAFMKSQETHLSVNSRLDAFMLNAKQAAYAQGVIEGRAAGRLAADARTDALTQLGPSSALLSETPVLVVPPK